MDAQKPHQNMEIKLVTTETAFKVEQIWIFTIFTGVHSTVTQTVMTGDFNGSRENAAVTMSELNNTAISAASSNILSLKGTPQIQLLPFV